MIRVVRSPKPAILLKKEAEWRNTLRRATTQAQKERALSKYRHVQIQKALKAMLHGKCAYCESKIEHISDAHIEHYKPKSRFPELAFDWDNLLLACGKCNSTKHKGDRFPETSEGGPLINPCTDDPDAHFTFHYDATAQLASVYGKTERGKTTETLMGLNRHDLREYRSRKVKLLAYLMLRARTDPEARHLMEEALRDDAEYAAFARALRADML